MFSILPTVMFRFPPPVLFQHCQRDSTWMQPLWELEVLWVGPLTASDGESLPRNHHSNKDVLKAVVAWQLSTKLWTRLAWLPWLHSNPSHVEHLKVQRISHLRWHVSARKVRHPAQNAQTPVEEGLETLLSAPNVHALSCNVVRMLEAFSQCQDSSMSSGPMLSSVGYHDSGHW